jgi:Transport and Golgi organisation 2
MCTVSYVPTNNGYYLTSNRDEKFTRKKALLPVEYTTGGVKLIFPKDGDAGGTWIALKENGDSLCLLNGAFENFTDTGMYTVSRGKIVLQIAAAFDMAAAFNNAVLMQTAPFTLIIVTHAKLFECRWDGQKKHCTLLDNSQPQIWSSATLYDSMQRKKRSNWFTKWISVNPNPSLYLLFHFHKNGGDGCIENDLVMNRNDKLYTVSITGIAVNPEECIMQYIDLKDNTSTTTSFTYKEEFSKAVR